MGLAALVFVTGYIPYLGAFLSGAVAVLVALADRGLVIGLWVLGIVARGPGAGGERPPAPGPEPHRADAPGGGHAGDHGRRVRRRASSGMLLAVPLTAAAFGVLGELRSPLFRRRGLRRWFGLRQGPGSDPGSAPARPIVDAWRACRPVACVCQ